MTGLQGPLRGVRPAGAGALLAEAADDAGVRALDAAVAHALENDAALAALVEDVVPASRTLLVVLREGPGSAAARRSILDVLAAAPPYAASPEPHHELPHVTLPVRYDGADLEEIATRCGTTPRALADLHTRTEFTVAFCGFAPGFAYLTGWPEELQVPRRDVPRTSVPAGSVGLGGEYCGVYPRSSPGGWQLLGTTDVVLFDPERTPPALLAPGVRVRFTEVHT